MQRSCFAEYSQGFESPTRYKFLENQSKPTVYNSILLVLCLYCVKIGSKTGQNGFLDLFISERMPLTVASTSLPLM